MAIVCSTCHTSNAFSFKDNCFVTEASDLKPRLCHDGRVYDDACDTGFIIVSARTGKEVLFVNDGVDENEGDIAGWRYKAIKIRNFGRWENLPPALKGLKALVIND